MGSPLAAAAAQSRAFLPTQACNTEQQGRLLDTSHIKEREFGSKLVRRLWGGQSSPGGSVRSAVSDAGGRKERKDLRAQPNRGRYRSVLRVLQRGAGKRGGARRGASTQEHKAQQACPGQPEPLIPRRSVCRLQCSGRAGAPQPAVAPSHSNTTVRLLCTITRSCRCQRTALASTVRSRSRPCTAGEMQQHAHGS